jgi:hypothetical protein
MEVHNLTVIVAKAIVFWIVIRHCVAIQKMIALPAFNVRFLWTLETCDYREVSRVRS